MRRYNYLKFLLIVLVLIFMTGCGTSNIITPSPYTVTYNGNSSTGGTVPADANNYEQGDNVTVLGNTGNLVKIQDGISLLFTGWNTVDNGSGTSYDAAATLTMGSANLTLYAQWSVIGGTGPAGGLIFYDKGLVSDGWRYLEAAPVSTEWTGIQWGSYETLIGGTEVGIGTGQANTTTIVTWLDSNSETDRAAQLCVALTEGDYSDWFLPSKEELGLMYTNLKKDYGVGGFSVDGYWSSSEYDAYNAWFQQFSNGSPFYTTKSNLYRVRAVRAFRSTAPTYIVNYNANGATGGTVPSDSYHYEPGETVTVLGNTGTLVKTGYVFVGWNTQADGGGTDYITDDTFSMSTSDVTLYAKWATVIDIAAITGVTAPVTGATPVTTITATAQYTGSVTWLPNDGVFAGETEYTATITLTAKSGFTLTGVAANFFTVTDAAATNPINSGVVTAVFPQTLLSVGDSYGGGIVAYILQPEETNGVYNYDASKQHGLIAAIADQTSSETGIIWAVTAHQSTSVGGTDILLGTGSANTDKIIAQNGVGIITYAAGLARAHNGGEYSDWFLPSKDELNLMYTNLKVQGVGGFANVSFWSSSELDAGLAWLQNFFSGNQFSSLKSNANRVRAVRAF